MPRLTLKCLMLNVPVLVSLLYLIFGICDARQGRYWRQNPESESKENGYRIGPYYGRLSSSMKAQEESSGTFNVLNYGVKGDGLTDDTKAFEAAWEAACKVAASTLVVPSGSTLVIGPVSFSGPNCEENIVVQLDGKIIAPTSSNAWGSGLLQWIEFKDLNRITVRGKGIIDGQGSVWWKNSPVYDPTDESESRSIGSNNTMWDQRSTRMPGTKPTALRFYGSNGVTVTGITIQNSPQTHLKFDNCAGVQVSGFTVSSPGDSPNTDGIHLQNSRDIAIYSSTLGCGDDCISIQTGCSDIYIHDVDCGPGHGISIGGLGRDNSRACVSNVTVRDVTMHNTLNGVRIKTWQGGSGSVQQVTFSNVQVNEVASPIVIDQYYCDGTRCHNASSAVAISGINYMNINGTYTREPVRFACSDSSPCTGVSLSMIALERVAEKAGPSDPFCWEAYGELKTTTVPPIQCLQTGKPTRAGSQSYNDAC